MSRRVALVSIVIAACAILVLVVAAVSQRENAPAATRPDTASHARVKGVRIAAAGDIACDPGSEFFAEGRGTGSTCRQLATSNTLVRGHYASVLTLGDTQYEDGAYEKFVASYDPSWGRVKSITKPAPGNHEYESSGATGYYGYFGRAAGDPRKGYYSFDVGRWHLIALNSNCSAVGGCGAGSPQEQWLRRDLAAHPAACTLAYWHHPRFSSGLHGSDSTYRAFWRALYDAGADVVLSGHDHDYERFARADAEWRSRSPSWPPPVRRRLGRQGLRPFSTVRANSEARDCDQSRRARADARRGRVRVAVPPAVGSFTDSGSTRCH